MLVSLRCLLRARRRARFTEALLAKDRFCQLGTAVAGTIHGGYVRRSGGLTFKLETLGRASLATRLCGRLFQLVVLCE